MKMILLDFKKFRFVRHAFCRRSTTSLGWPACRQALDLAVGGQRAEFMHRILASKASGKIFFANCENENSTDLVFFFSLSSLSNGRRTVFRRHFFSKRCPRNGAHALSDETSVLYIYTSWFSTAGHKHPFNKGLNDRGRSRDLCIFLSAIYSFSFLFSGKSILSLQYSPKCI